jgi:light-regulated signal transduction histidine kinase (bacteriophytochrome)
LHLGVICGLANHTLLIRKDGTEVAIDDSGAPIKTASGDTVGVVLVFRDITLRKKTEEDLRLYAEELEEANQELEAFSYSVSHDLRAPLRGIDGFSFALLEDYGDKLDQQGQNYLRQIRESTQLMGQLIDGMLRLSRTSRAEMYPMSVNLTEIAESILQDLQKSQPARKAEFIISAAVNANGDKTLLAALLRNLFENAWKFTSGCQMTRIEFGVVDHDGTSAYFVRDNGIGFDMQYSDKLFKPFSRLHTRDEYPGTGIGLANVQRIVRRHGGQVWADARPGEGATFHFTLEK